MCIAIVLNYFAPQELTRIFVNLLGKLTVQIPILLLFFKDLSVVVVDSNMTLILNDSHCSCCNSLIIKSRFFVVVGGTQRLI